MLTTNHMSVLFEALDLGDLRLKNRILMAPLTRCRAPGHVPNELMVEYYRQRATAGLIITEATAVSPRGIGYLDVPGIWNQAQIQGWRKVTQAVHDKGGLIVLQLWHAGRMAHPILIDDQLPVAPSAIAAGQSLRLRSESHPLPVPHALSRAEIGEAIAEFAAGAANALAAGFDGVELHGANGYLLDQFLQDNSNVRDDHYGGSIANRARFALEVMDAVIKVWGPRRVGLHISPRCDAHGMGDSSPAETFGYLVSEASSRNLAFICSRERVGDDMLGPKLKQLFKSGAYIANEGFEFETADQLVATGGADAVAFGRKFIANPDLPARFRSNKGLNELKPETFYTIGPIGYIDYPSLSES